jgi:hypothetical protein
MGVLGWTATAPSRYWPDGGYPYFPKQIVQTIGYISSSTEALYAVTHSTELVYSAAVSIEGDEGP